MAIFDNNLSVESFSPLPSKFCQPFYCRLVLIGPKTPSYVRNLLCLLSARYYFSFCVASSRSRLAVESFFSVLVLSTSLFSFSLRRVSLTLAQTFVSWSVTLAFAFRLGSSLSIDVRSRVTASLVWEARFLPLARAVFGSTCLV